MDHQNIPLRLFNESRTHLLALFSSLTGLFHPHHCSNNFIGFPLTIESISNLLHASSKPKPPILPLILTHYYNHTHLLAVFGRQTNNYCNLTMSKPTLALAPSALLLQSSGVLFLFISAPPHHWTHSNLLLRPSTFRHCSHQHPHLRFACDISA